MDFVLQIPWDETRFPVVEFDGVLYGFWCPDCRVTTSDQQCT